MVARYLWSNRLNMVASSTSLESKLGESLVSNVIRFLESLGGSARGQISAADYAATVVALEGVEAEHRQALLDRNVPALNELLDGRSKMFCMIIAPDGAEEQGVPDQSDEESESGVVPEEE